MQYVNKNRSELLISFKINLITLLLFQVKVGYKTNDAWVEAPDYRAIHSQRENVKKKAYQLCSEMIFALKYTKSEEN